MFALYRNPAWTKYNVTVEEPVVAVTLIEIARHGTVNGTAVEAVNPVTDNGLGITGAAQVAPAAV